MPIFNGEPSGRAPVTGTFGATGASASFSPVCGRDFNVAISGTFVGVAQLERSFDGSTWFPITAHGVQLYAWSSPAAESFCEPEYGVLYRWNCTAYTSGTINYRISQ